MAIEADLPRADQFSPIDEYIDKVIPSIRALRHDLHRHPELAYEEKRTVQRVADELKRCPGWEVETGLAKTGLIATLGRDKPGPAVALRADMDALPIEEASGVPYASENPGVMHACGHDGHTAMLVGAAQVLSAIQDTLCGPVRLIFQPAEEGGAGGKRMVEAGALKNPEISAVYGLHNMPRTETQAGDLCLCPGAAMAGTASWDLEVCGRGGHAAVPDAAVDPIYIGSAILTAIQGIVSRRTDPIKNVVITCTQFHAGSAYNVIPETANLCGTIRALDDAVMAKTIGHFQKQVEGIARALGGEAKLKVKLGYPVTLNHPRTDALWREVVQAIGREQDLVEVPPMMGGEDFAFYQQVVPGTFWFLAARPEGVPEVPFCHHPAFDFNDAILSDGIRLHVELARRFAHLWGRDSAGTVG